MQKELDEVERQVTDKEQLTDAMALKGVERRKAVSKLVAGALLSIFAPNGQQCEETEARAQMMVDFARVALTLTAYRTEQGGFLESLTGLSPRYLPEVPPDRFSGSALQYKNTGKRYLFYSVGSDGKDDSGNSQRVGNPMGDDWAVSCPPKPE